MKKTKKILLTSFIISVAFGLLTIGGLILLPKSSKLNMVPGKEYYFTKIEGAGGENKNNFTNTQGEKYYYGKIGGFQVFQAKGEYESFVLDGHVFKNDEPFEILLYKNENYINLIKAYIGGEISSLQLSTIANMHKEFAMEEMDVNEKSYLDKSDIQVYYDIYGNVIPSIKPLTEEQSNILQKHDLLNQVNNRLESYLGEYNGYLAVAHDGSGWGINDFYCYDTIFHDISNSTTIYLVNQYEKLTLNQAYLQGKIDGHDLYAIDYYLYDFYERYTFEEIYEYYCHDIVFCDDYYVTENNTQEHYNMRDLEIYHKFYSLGAVQDNNFVELFNSIFDFDFEYEKYFGLINDYHIYLVENKNAERNNYVINGARFYHNKNFELYAFNEESEKFNFFKLCEQSTFTEEQIKAFSAKFKALQRLFTFRNLNEEEYRDFYSEIKKQEETVLTGNDYATNEKNLENYLLEIVKIFGTDIYSVDLTDVDVYAINDSYYISFATSLISSIENGRQQGNITFTIDKNIYDKAISLYNIEVNTDSNVIYNPNLIIHKYGYDCLQLIEKIINDSNTKLYTVKNIETNELLYALSK